eukprot:g4083.t1
MLSGFLLDEQIGGADGATTSAAPLPPAPSTAAGVKAGAEVGPRDDAAASLPAAEAAEIAGDRFICSPARVCTHTTAEQALQPGFAPPAPPSSRRFQNAVHRAFRILGLAAADVDEHAAIAFRQAVAQYLATSPAAVWADARARDQAEKAMRAIAGEEGAERVRAATAGKLRSAGAGRTGGRRGLHRADVLLDHVYVTGVKEGGAAESGANITFAVLAEDQDEAQAMHVQLLEISRRPMPFCRLLRGHGILKADREKGLIPAEAQARLQAQARGEGDFVEAGRMKAARARGRAKGKGKGKGKKKGRGKGKGGKRSGGGADEDGSEFPDGAARGDGAESALGGTVTAAAAAASGGQLCSQWFEATGAMQVELMSRKEALLLKAQRNAVTLKDISDHQMHISALIADMEKSKEEITRKYRITEALLKQAREPRRAGTIGARMEALRRREKIFNENVSFLNREVAWFHDSPAFKKAQQYVQDNWVQCGDQGPWVHKDDLEEDEVVDFSTLLAEMKMEDEAGQADGQGGGTNGTAADSDSAVRNDSIPEKERVES